MQPLTFTPSHRAGSGAPLVLLHGFTDTWRTWELVLGALQRRHDVLAVTLAGHAGGPRLEAPLADGMLADHVERAMDAAGFATAHVAGNSLGGFVALELAARGRAESVVALAPAGGWARDDWGAAMRTLDHYERLQELVRAAAPHASALLATDAGRRRATQDIVERYEHIPVELLAHQMLGAAACTGATALIEHARVAGWPVDAERIDCPVRVVWGTSDRLLPWPSAAARYRSDWLPHADWVVLDGVGHCPQLDVPHETLDLISSFISPVHR
jgi:pimeloyl-ACP methyl ester carboxylesterase